MAGRSLLLLLALVPSALCLDNGVSLVPSLGWNSWNAFHSDISEELIVQTAAFMVNMTLVKAGYDTIVLDGMSP
jgi:alpha-galactosidase